jgi:hypothetical protein
MAGEGSNMPLLMPDAAARRMRQQQQMAAASSMFYSGDSNGYAYASAPMSYGASASASAQAPKSGNSLSSLLKTQSSTKLDLAGFTRMPDVKAFAELVINSEPLKAKIASAMEEGQTVTIFAPNNKAMAALPNRAHEKMKSAEFASARHDFVAEHVAFGLDQKAAKAASQMSSDGSRSMFAQSAALAMDTASDNPEGRGVVFHPTEDASGNAVSLVDDNRQILGSGRIESTHLFHGNNLQVHVIGSALSG